MTTAKEVYCPDIVHDFAIDFINRNKDKPFFVYYATHLVHLPMERTPDSKPGTTDNKALYADNLAYMDKQIGLIVKEPKTVKRMVDVFEQDWAETDIGQKELKEAKKEAKEAIKEQKKSSAEQPVAAVADH